MQQPQGVTASSDPLILRTLGALGLYRGGEDTPLIPPGKPIALLAYLSALPGRRANREHLVNLLWAPWGACVWGSSRSWVFRGE
jgi:hypothetical protein